MIRQPMLRGVVSAQVLLSFVLTGSFFTALALLTEQGHPIGAGLVTALTAVGLIVGSALAPRLGARLAPSLAIATQAILWALALGMLAMWPSLAIAAAALALMWLLVPTSRVTVEVWIADHITSRSRGRTQSIRSLANALASPLGPVVCGLLIESFNYRTTLLALASISIIAALISALSHRAAR